MSKAEKRALNAYPVKIAQREGYDENLRERKGFIKGYKQAEKDLDVLSLVKEMSGVKEMSRAKEEALKAYPPQSISANYDTINRRDAFEFGYLKAEKDLALTWEDIKEIYFLFRDVLNEWYGLGFNDEGICQEVLKRFKEKKGKDV